MLIGTDCKKTNGAYRYKGLVAYISGRYSKPVEVGIGNCPDVAFALLQNGINVFATDIYPFRYSGLKVVVDDIIKPDVSIYRERDLIYSLRSPVELVPYMISLARRLSTDLIVKPLSSEYPGGQLLSYESTTFFLWYSNEKI